MATDTRTLTIVTVLLIGALVMAFVAGWGLGRNQLYHEIFMEDVELEVVPLDSLPERIGTINRSA